MKKQREEERQQHLWPHAVLREPLLRPREPSAVGATLRCLEGCVCAGDDERQPPELVVAGWRTGDTADIAVVRRILAADPREAAAGGPFPFAKAEGGVLRFHGFDPRKKSHLNNPGGFPGRSTCCIRNECFQSMLIKAGSGPKLRAKLAGRFIRWHGCTQTWSPHQVEKRALSLHNACRSAPLASYSSHHPHHLPSAAILRINVDHQQGALLTSINHPAQILCEMCFNLKDFWQ